MDIKTTVLIEETVTYLVEVLVGQGGDDRAISTARRTVRMGEAQPENRQIISVKIVKREDQLVTPLAKNNRS